MVEQLGRASPSRGAIESRVCRQPRAVYGCLPAMFAASYGARVHVLVRPLRERQIHLTLGLDRCQS